MTPRPVQPIRHPIDARVRVPASSRIATIELALAALAEGRSELDLGALDPGDEVRAMRDAVAALGVEVDTASGGIVRVGGRPHGGALERTELSASGSGTVARFAASLAATLPATTRIADGSGREVDLAPLAGALRKLGARVEGDALPVTVSGPLRGGRIEIAGHLAGQVAPSLLIAAAATERGIELRTPGTAVADPSVELAVRMLEEHGVKVERLGAPNAYWIGPQGLRGRSSQVDGDAALAIYPAAAAAILGGRATVENVAPQRRPGGQPELRAFEILEELGCAVSRLWGGLTVRRRGALHGVRGDLHDILDLLPAIAVVACCAEGRTEILGVGRARHEGGDLLASVAKGLRALGGRVTEYADGLAIDPVPLHGGTVDAAGDSRVAMAFSVLGLSVPGVAIEGAEAIARSYPGFHEMLAELGH